RGAVRTVRGQRQAVKLPFTRLTEAALAPARATEGDAGYDLHAAEDATLPPGARASVGTGVAFAIPEGHAGLVRPRSGLALRRGRSRRGRARRTSGTAPAG